VVLTRRKFVRPPADQSFSLLTWRILTLRTCSAPLITILGRGAGTGADESADRTVAPAMLAHIEMRRLGKFGQCLAFRHASWRASDGPIRSGRSAHWVKVKNPNAPAVKREAEEDWGK
jgi:hypothetical protein